MAKRNFTTDMLSVSGSNILNTALQLPLGIILARSLGPELNGLYTYILIIPMLVSTISRLGIKRSTIFYIGKKTFNQEEIISALAYIFIFTSILAMLVTGGIYFFMEKKNLTLAMAMMAILSIPVNILINYASGIFIGTDSIKKYNIFQWIPTLLNLLLLVVFLLIIRWSIAGALLAYLLSSMLMAYYALKLIKDEFNINLKYNLAIIKSMIKLGFTFTLSGIILKLHYRIDILILERLTDMKEVGYYSLAARLAEKWNGPLTIGAIISSRTAISEDIDTLKYNILRWIKVTFLLSLVGCIILYFVVPYVLPLLYGKKFIPSIVMVQAILPGILMMVVSKTLTSFFSGSGKPYVLLVSCSVSLVSNIILNFILIPLYGGVGAAIATNISYTILAIILLTVFATSTKIPLKEMITYSREDFKVLRRIKNRILKV